MTTDHTQEGYPLKVYLSPEAIAQALSDMGAEITGLEARRAQTPAIKQGTMQKLLTRKTRLIESNHA